MRARLWFCVTLAGVAALTLDGCAATLSAPHAPSIGAVDRSVVLMRPNNRTGNDLIISGGSLLEQYALHSAIVTVPDAVAAAARQELAARGYRIVPFAPTEDVPSSMANAAVIAARHGITANVLYIEIRRWEADAPFRPAFIIVSLEMTLIRPGDRHVVWRVDHPSRPVQTAGVGTAGEADGLAVERVVTEMFQAVPAVLE